MIKGDEIYAIVKNNTNFKLEIISAIITNITKDKIEVSKERTAFETDVYIFTKDKAKEFIFYNLDEAEHKLNIIR
jgi:hypothetical protein